MPKFSSSSLIKLATCHPDLRRIATIVIEQFDFTVIEGYRGRVKQEIAYRNGASQVNWPDSKHNDTPSNAYDLMPWPIDWTTKSSNTERSCLLAGIVLSTAWTYGIELRWGGDWNMDGDTRDEKFRDYGHFERREK